MEARKAMFALSRQGKAQGLGLDTNYRSSGGMVEAYNAAFTHRGWFHAHPIDPTDTSWRLPAEPDPLGYVPVKHGDLAVQKPIDSTLSGKPIILKDFALGNPDKHALKRRVNHWIAAEIAALMADPERLRIPDKASGGFRPLAWGDICVLVRKSREKDALLRLLAEAGIPAQVARRSGLYEGDAAGQYLAVLESLEDPGDPGKHARALLTRFFRAPGDPPPDRPPETPHPLFEEWLRLSARRHWQKLFHSLQYRSGLLYRESLGEEPDRRIMDFIHVGQNLVQEAIRENLNLGALVQRLKDLRAAAPGASGTDEDADMHREESEGGKVVLMTMHVSKGLEFPVVFLANFSGNPPQSHYKYRDGLNTVYHLNTGDATARRAYKEESEGEDRRLYYVALTRARYKLYVPLLPPGSGNGTTGPLGGFVAEALRTAAALKPDLYHFAPAEDYSLPPAPLPRFGNAGAGRAWAASVPAVHPGRPGWVRTSGVAACRRRCRRRCHRRGRRLPRGLSTRGSPVQARRGFLAPPPSARVLLPPGAKRPRPRAFFRNGGRALRQGRRSCGGYRCPAEDGESDDGCGSDPRRFPATRCPGARTSETCSTKSWSASTSRPWDAAPRPAICSTMRPPAISSTRAWRITAWDRNGGTAWPRWFGIPCGLPCPIPRAAPPFPFPKWPARTSGRRWNSFSHTPCARTAGSTDPTGPAGPGPDGYLWGFIDLVFRHRGRYYLLDWKSNHLDAYGSADLDRSMRESRYDVQYMLYSLALDKWLRGLIPDYRYETHFGGVYYLYLRGMRAPVSRLPFPMSRQASAPPRAFSP